MKKTLILLIILFNTYNYGVVIGSFDGYSFIWYLIYGYIPTLLLVVGNIGLMLYHRCGDCDIRELR